MHVVRILVAARYKLEITTTRKMLYLVKRINTHCQLCTSLKAVVSTKASHQSGWLGFNPTTLRQQPHFCQYCSQQTGWQPRGHSWQSRDRWFQIVWKRHFLVFKAQRCREPILITQKWRWKFTWLDATATLYCNCTTSNLMATALFMHISLLAIGLFGLYTLPVGAANQLEARYCISS